MNCLVVFGVFLSLLGIRSDAAAVQNVLRAGGYSLDFDGVDDFILVTSSSPSFAEPAHTLTAWVKVKDGSQTKDQTVFGAPLETGTNMFLSRKDGKYGLKEFSPFWNSNMNCTEYDTNIDLGDQDWHFVAISVGLEVDGTDWLEQTMYVDGQVSKVCHCLQQNYKPLYPSMLSVGTRNPEDLSIPLAANFQGSIDDLKYFDQALESADILKVYRSNHLTESLVSATMHLSFDEGTGVQVHNVESDTITGSLGNGKLLSAPRFEASSAPIAGDLLIGELNTKYDWIGTSVVTLNLEQLGSLNIGGVSEVNFNTVSISNINGSGSVSFATEASIDKDSDALDVSSSIPQNMTFTPGAATTPWEATVTLKQGASTFSQTVTVRILPRDNTKPQAGNGGRALWCDGVDDYAANHEFTWTTKEFDTPDGKKFGGEPITVEWWAWISKDTEGDTAIWTIGNEEVTSTWVEDWDPFGKGGRLVARFPFFDGNGYIFVGQAMVMGSMVPYYDQWTHFALVAEQAAGKTMKLYLNGELFAENTDTGYRGVGVPDPGVSDWTGYEPIKTDIRSIYVCSWTFWSGVYNKGYVDSLRVYNKIRTQEEIKQDMYRELDPEVAPTIDGLVGYWDFDDANEDTAYDVSAGGHDLEFSGCAPCIDNFKGYTPKRCLPCVSDRTCELDENNCLDYPDVWNTFGDYPKDSEGRPSELINCVRAKELGDNVNGCDKEDMMVCMPSNQVQTDYSYPVFGAVNCYTNGSYTRSSLLAGEKPKSHPTKVFSEAPIGGRNYEQVLQSGSWYSFQLEVDAATLNNRAPKPKGSIVIKLNGTDPDGDMLRFGVSTLPSTGAIFYVDPNSVTADDYYVKVTTGLLPLGVEEVLFVPTDDFLLGTVESNQPKAGGNPLSSFSYYANDGVVSSPSLNVDIIVECPPGTFLKSDVRQCIQCPIGSFQKLWNTEPACNLCPAGMYQSMEGQTSCEECDLGSYAAEDGSGECLQCSTLPPLSNNSTNEIDSFGCERKLYLNGDEESIKLKIPVSGDATSEYTVYTIESISGSQRVFQASNNGEESDDSLSEAIRRRDRSVKQWISSAEADFASTFTYIDPITGETEVRHSTRLITGEPDGMGYESGLVINADSSVAVVTVHLDTAVFIESLTVYGTDLDQNILQIEALSDNKWEKLWFKGSSTALGNGQVSPDICPTSFSTTSMRFSFRGVIFVDAIQVFGSPTLSGLKTGILKNGNGVFYLRSAEYKIFGTKQSFSLSYTSKKCSAGIMDSVRSGVLSVDLEVEPEFSQRNESLSTIVSAAAFVGIAVSVIMMAILIKNSDTFIVKAATPLFCYGIISGMIVQYIWLVLSAQAHTSTDPEGSCMLTPYMLLLSFQLIFSLLFAKTWRIHVVFNNTSFKRISITPMMMLKPVFMFMAVTIVYLLAWTIVDPLERQIVKEGTTKYYVCKSESFDIWYYMLFVLIGLPVAFGVRISWKVRKVELLAFNESSAIATSIYSIFVVGVLLIIVKELLTGDENSDAAFVITSFGIFLMNMTTAGVLFGPKVGILIMDPDAAGEVDMNTKVMAATSATVAPISQAPPTMQVTSTMVM